MTALEPLARDAAGRAVGPLAVVRDAVRILVEARGALGGAALAIALLFFGLVGPFAILLVALVERAPDLVRTLLAGPLAGGSSPLAPADEGIAAAFSLTVLVALAGSLVLTIDGQIVALVELAGRAAGRPVALRAAVGRARRAFWAFVRVSLLVGVPLLVVNELATGAFEEILGEGSIGAILGGIVGTAIVGAPVAYVQSFVVLAGSGALEALRRSIGLFRRRPGIAAVVAVSTALAQFVLALLVVVAAVGLADVADRLGLGVTGDAGGTFATLVVLSAMVLGAGAALFAVNAIALAPQVAAYARLAEAPDRLAALVLGGATSEGSSGRAEHAAEGGWLTPGMIAGIALAVVASIAGVSGITQRG